MAHAEEIDTAIKLLDLIQRLGNTITSTVNDPRASTEEREEAARKLIKMNHLLYAIIRELNS